MTDPVPDTGTQFAGLTPAERAIAAVIPHMSTCDAPTIDDCGVCRNRLELIRRDLAAVTPVIRRQDSAIMKQLVDKVAEHIKERKSWLEPDDATVERAGMALYETCLAAGGAVRLDRAAMGDDLYEQYRQMWMDRARVVLAVRRG